MMRATGFLLGAVLMLAVFLFVLGDGTPPSALQVPVSSAAVTPPPPTDPAPAGDDSGAVASLDDEDLPDVTGNGLELDPKSRDESLGAYKTGSPNVAKTDDTMPDDTIKASRYRVWSPFHSKWAAEGFAQRLSRATDVPVEVVNEGPGNYQVVFSYRDDGERQAMVEQIETVTGLELE